MKHIPLTQGKFAIVDDADYEELSKYYWCACKHKRAHVWYAVRSGHVKMHHQVLGRKIESNDEVDHLNGNGLDNRKVNLRICSHSVNMQNRHVLKKNKSCKYQGVCWDKNRKSWVASICKDQKQMTIGRYKSQDVAAKAYDVKALELYGVHAKVNFPVNP